MICVACNQVYGLEATQLRDAPTFAAPDRCDPPYIVDGDADADGLPNRTDPCPLDANNADRDGDGVGDACDPSPDLADDCIVLFDDFHTEDRGCWLGPWTRGCGGSCSTSSTITGSRCRWANWRGTAA